jgi:hypothetical protein
MWNIVSDWVARSVLVWRHMDYCFKLGGSECASVLTCGLLFQTGWFEVCFCADMWTIVSNWVVRSVLVWRHMDYCFRLGGSECSSVATYGLLFQIGWLGVC